MDLSKLTRKKLYEIAKERKIFGRSKMKKIELLNAIEKLNLLSQKKENFASSNENISSQSTPKNTVPRHSVNINSEYEIPEKYNIDTLVLLPVNPEKEFVFWEISDDTEKKLQFEFSLKEISYILKIFKKSDNSKQEITSVKVDKIGKYYFYIPAQGEQIWCEIGILNNNIFNSILSSEKIFVQDVNVKEIEDLKFLKIDEKLNKLYELSGIFESDSGYLEIKKEQFETLTDKENS